MTKNKIHYLAILYKRGSVKNFFQKTNTPPQNNKTKTEKKEEEKKDEEEKDEKEDSKWVKQLNVVVIFK